MESTIDAANQQPIISKGGVDMTRLQDWSRQYVAIDGNELVGKSLTVRSVDSDYIDMNEMERRIERRMATTTVSRGFCTSCQQLFDEWPDFGTKKSKLALGRAFYTNGLDGCSKRMQILRFPALAAEIHRIAGNLPKD